MAAETSARVGTRRKPIRTRGKPTDVDRHVGTRIRHRRMLLGLSQQGLGEALSVTFQQVQKYERGANRIGAGRLYELSRALRVPITYFFEGIEEPSDAPPPPSEPSISPKRRRRRASQDTGDLPNDAASAAPLVGG